MAKPPPRPARGFVMLLLAAGLLVLVFVAVALVQAYLRHDLFVPAR